MTLYIDSTLQSVDFSIPSSEDIQSSSVTEISNGVTYIENIQKMQGVLDPNLGTTSAKHNCFFCKENHIHCIGHTGFVKLNEIMFHKPMISIILSILECICTDTCELLLNNKQKKYVMQFNKKNRLNEIKKLVKKNKFIHSPYSKKSLYKFHIDFKDKIYGLISVFAENKETKEVSILSARQIYDIFCKISKKNSNCIGIDDLHNLFFDNFPIPPVTIRPSMKGDEWSNSYGESHLTQKISDIIKWNNKLGEYKKDLNELDTMPNKLIKKKTIVTTEDIIDKVNKAKTMLQYHIFSYYDNESSDLPKSILRTGSSQATRSLTYRYKLGKQGRIRANLNGKRVNYSARTVITSDSDIHSDEVGVPLHIAMTITYPERVTSINFEEMKHCLRNGKSKYPGCNIIEVMDNRSRSNVKFDVQFFRVENLKIGDIVHRHLINGDYILFNRQPSLHKMNMMCHKVSILSHSNVPKDQLLSFRLNVSCTDPYNADFDGDEMNLHGCQSITTKIELNLLVNVAKNFVSPRNAQPIIALKQDSLIGLYLFSKNNRSFSFYQCQLLFNNIDYQLQPKSYTSTELLSLLLPDNFNFSKSDICIENGMLIHGFLNKDHIGSKKKNILHFLSNLQGNKNVLQIMDNLHKLSNNFLRYIHGFTIGIKDFHVPSELQQELEDERKSRILDMEHLLYENVQHKKNVSVMLYSELLFKKLDGIKIDQASFVRNKLDDTNNMYIMTSKSKSKGDISNIGFCMTCLGQTAFNAELIPFSITNRRTLSYFARNDYTPFAKGFIFNNYFDGLNVSEFCYHNLDGRVGLIDTAIKTGETGYLQRKLIKAAEDAYVDYNYTIRNSLQNIIQFHYQNGYRNEYLYYTSCHLYKQTDNEILKRYKYFCPQLLTYVHNMRDYVNMYPYNHLVKNMFSIPFDIDNLLHHSITINKEKSNKKCSCKELKQYIDDIIAEYMSHQINNRRKNVQHYEFIIYIILVEKLATTIFNTRVYGDLFKMITKKMKFKILQPGDMIGITTAQSIGEPLTQFTLK